jgi:hypothetical protein
MRLASNRDGLSHINLCYLRNLRPLTLGLDIQDNVIKSTYTGVRPTAEEEIEG